MYRNLGVPWATSVLGFVALALMPVPLLFFVYGARIRKLSKFVPVMPPGMGPGGPMGAGPPLPHPTGPPAVVEVSVVDTELDASLSTLLKGSEKV